MCRFTALKKIGRMANLFYAKTLILSQIKSNQVRSG